MEGVKIFPPKLDEIMEKGKGEGRRGKREFSHGEEIVHSFRFWEKKRKFFPMFLFSYFRSLNILFYIMESK